MDQCQLAKGQLVIVGISQKMGSIWVGIEGLREKQPRDSQIPHASNHQPRELSDPVCGGRQAADAKSLRMC